MENTKFNHEIVRDLIAQGYHVIASGVPEKIEGDLWEYLLTLDEEDDVLVLADLLEWSDDDLARIGEPKEAQDGEYTAGIIIVQHGDAGGFYHHVHRNDEAVGIGYVHTRTGRILYGLVKENGETKRIGVEGYDWQPVITEVEIYFEKSYEKASE